MAQARLEVYVSEGCWVCQESFRLVAEITPQFPGIDIALIDLSDQRLPDHVFAVPTYVLNGRTIYLGNPTQEELIRKLATIQQPSLAELSAEE